MAIAIVWPAESRLVEISVRFERYIRGFRALGHEAYAVCTSAAALGFAEPAITCSNLAELNSPGFWDRLRPDAALVITWLGMADVLKALRPCCPFIVSIADSDGQVGVRAHPRASWQRMLAQQRTLINKVRAAKFWLQQYLYADRRVAAPAIASAELSDAVIVGSAKSVECLRHFYATMGRADLGRKVHAIPYPVDDCFSTSEVRKDRIERLVAIGRWDDPQKDAPWLAAALELALRRRPTLQVSLFGPGGERCFAPLCRKHQTVLLEGTKSAAIIAQRLAESRALVLSSLWESGPIVASEALSLGCTLIGPASIPSFASAVREGPFGTLAARRSPRALADAVLSEMAAWDAGQRDPIAQASYWRPRFTEAAVCGQLAALWQGSPSHGQQYAATAR